MCRTAPATAFGSAASYWWWLQLGLGGVIPSLPIWSSSPWNAMWLINSGVQIFWTKKRVTLGKPISRARCSAHWGVVRQPDVLRWYWRGARRDILWAWERSSPKAGFTQGHRARLHRAELSADAQVSSRSCFETSNNRLYSDTVKEALGAFMFPAYVLWLSKGHTKPESIFLGLCRLEPYTLYFHQVSPSVSHPRISKCCF